jgi:drug/metabolite transporter (DMT)-like permease
MSASLSYFLILGGLGRIRQSVAKPVHFRDLGWVALMGGASFCYSPLLQMTGLSTSRATDNALLIAVEPLLLLSLGVIIYRERLRPVLLVSLLMAMTGFWFLSGLSSQRLRGGLDAHLVGNLLMVFSLLGEATFSLAGRKVLGKFPELGGFGLALIMGTGMLTMALPFLAPFPDLGSLSARSIVGVLFMGPLGTAAAYLFWLFAMKEASLGALAITLYVQPVFGALWGVLFLGERLPLSQALGGLLILVAVGLP